MAPAHRRFDFRSLRVCTPADRRGLDGTSGVLTAASESRNGDAPEPSLMMLAETPNPRSFIFAARC